MKRIDEQVGDQKCLARKILSWIICASRPLIKSELQHALAVEPGALELDPDNIPRVMVEVCAGLVTVDEESSVIRLVHYTAQEYFGRTREEHFPEAESEVAETCVTYVSFSVFGSGYCQTDDEFGERLRSYPLYSYAARNWGHHARRARLPCQGVVRFLKCKKKVQASSQALMATIGSSQHVQKRMTCLHLAAYFGLDSAARSLLTRNLVDRMDSDGRTPLSYAAEKGHKAVVELLLSTGAVAADVKDQNSRTPLLWAVMHGNEAVVQLLLETHNVDLDARDHNGRPSLWWAAKQGHESIVKLLLGTGQVNIDVKVQFGRTTLSWAVANRHEAVVELLLQTGQVDVNAEDIIFRQSPLSLVLEKGHVSIAKLLLATNQVDVNAPDQTGWITTLSRAAAHGHEATVKLLLPYVFVDINLTDLEGQTPLSWAGAQGHEAMVKLLLQNESVDIHVRDHGFRTALIWAGDCGHKEIVKLLRAAGCRY